ncbi:MAG: multidrug resistance efflux transporter family protein, partial [Alphaproteobacteria bacterium]|nr:multidrug resistance efflux transporter family protein [Alphaproteobacteria bacterium]
LLAGFTWRQVALGIAPILVGAVAYPLGNQLLATARSGGGRLVPALGDGVLSDAAACVFLMALGSMPFWAALLAVTRPPEPSADQVLAIAVVAVCSGAIGTAIFIYARHKSRDPYAVAAVDATQAGEVPFTVLGEVLILGAAWPQAWGWAGILLVIGGLVGLTLRSGAPAQGKT